MNASLYQLLIYGLSIVLIDLTLAGDNALVIALAVRSLPRKQRRQGMLIGAGAAVALRVLITFVAVKLLDVEFVKLAGGAFVLYIAVKVFAESEAPEEAVASPRQIWQAVRYIVFADITMSTDNVLAIAGASHGSLLLIIFGLGLSIPLVVLSSHFWIVLMNRYPWTVYVGAGVLGWVGSDMILTDQFIVRTLHPTKAVAAAVEIAAIIGVLVISRIVGERKKA